METTAPPAAPTPATRRRRALLRGGTTSAGNAVALLVDGAQAFVAMLAAIAEAQESIALESYIFAPDTTGRRFLAALVQAQERGVQVRLIIDGLGSLGTDARFFAPLLRAGGALAIYGAPRWGLPGWRRLWRRDHRKLLVVDACRAFIGGLNIADAYAPPSWGGGGWHDMHAEVQGPAAMVLASIFAQTWSQQHKKRWRLGPLPEPRGSVVVSILESRLSRRLSVRRAYLEAIGSATRSICICNAYCIPDGGILRAMQRACARGVRLQLLLAGTTDLRSVQYATRSLYSRLLSYGAEIYEWTEQVLHAKSAVVDGNWCSLGSYNMDRRSLLHNLEANLACEDPGLGAAMATVFADDLARSRRIDPAAWHRRPILQKLLEKIFYKLRFVL